MKFDVIIVGSGLSGSYVAKKLSQLGLNVIIVEKSKAIGGRFSTKPVGGGIADYGCQFIRPKTKLLLKLVAIWENKNLIKSSKFIDSSPTFIAPYGMNTIPRYLSLGIKILLNQKVLFLKKDPKCWEVKTDSFTLKSNALVLTMPIDQVNNLLKLSGIEIKVLLQCNYKSFHTITFQSDDDLDSKAISSRRLAPWICNNLLKGLSTEKNTYTINLSPNLSPTLIELKKNKKHELIDKHLKDFGFNNYSFLNLHYWKYAFTENQNNMTNYFDENFMLGICGDSFSIGQADGAVVSAQKTFESLNNTL